MPDIILSAATGSRLSHVKLPELPGLAVIAAAGGILSHLPPRLSIVVNRDLAARCAIARACGRIDR